MKLCCGCEYLFYHFLRLSHVFVENWWGWKGKKCAAWLIGKCLADISLPVTWRTIKEKPSRWSTDSSVKIWSFPRTNHWLFKNCLHITQAHDIRKLYIDIVDYEIHDLRLNIIFLFLFFFAVLLFLLYWLNRFLFFRRIDLLWPYRNYIFYIIVLWFYYQWLYLVFLVNVIYLDLFKIIGTVIVSNYKLLVVVLHH